MNINLLPPESAAKRYGLSLWALALGGMSTLAIVFVALAGMEQSTANAKIASFKSLQIGLTAEESKSSELQSQLKGLAPNLHSQLDSELQYNVKNFLQAISASAPKSMNLSSFSTSGPLQVNLSGSIGSMADLETFEVSLQSIRGIHDVWINTATEGANGLVFSLTIQRLNEVGH